MGEQHPSMGGKSRRSRRSGTRGEVTTCGGPAPGWPPPTPHTWLPPTTGFPPAHSHKGVSPHSSLSSSKFRQRKSRRGVAPSLWCPNWLSLVFARILGLIRKHLKVLTHASETCLIFWVYNTIVGCVVWQSPHPP